MARSGEALSVYVIRRDFRRVMRGYDPVEVEQHLERVSRWFAEHRVGQEARHLETQLDARRRAIEEDEARAARALEGANVEAEATVEGARLRADATLAEADRRAAEVVASV